MFSACPGGVLKLPCSILHISIRPRDSHISTDGLHFRFLFRHSLPMGYS